MTCTPVLFGKFALPCGKYKKRTSDSSFQFSASCAPKYRFKFPIENDGNCWAILRSGLSCGDTLTTNEKSVKPDSSSLG